MPIVNEIYLEWDETPGAVSYNLYRSPDDVTYSLLGSGITDLFYSDPTGTTDDWYKVAGVDAGSVEGELSDPFQGIDVSDVCLVRGSIVNPDGSPADGEPVEIAYYVDSGWGSRKGDLPRFAQGSLLTRTESTAYTDWRGIVEFPVVKLALVIITVRQTGYQCKVQIPDQAEIELEALAAIGTMIPVMEYPF